MILYGYVKGEKYRVEDSIEQICAFIMKFRYELETVIVDISDTMFLTTSMGFIFSCADQEFLRSKLIPALVPMQRGEVRAPEFKPL